MWKKFASAIPKDACMMIGIGGQKEILVAKIRMRKLTSLSLRLVSAIATVALLCCATPVQASPITYTITTTATGTLGASPFTNALVTLVLTGNTSAVTVNPSNNFLYNPGTAIVNIAGLGSAMLTGSIIAATPINGATLAGQLGVVIAQLDNPPSVTPATGILWTLGPAFAGYNLQTALGPVSGSGSVANQGPIDGFFATTAGNLQFAPGQGGGAGTSTFTAAALPEPGRLGLLGAGLITLVAGRAFRRRFGIARLKEVG